MILSIGGDKQTIVDNDSSDDIINSRWSFDTTGYARRSVKTNGKAKKIYLHRVVASARQGEIVDHINGDKLDNRKENLRIVTHAENIANKKMQVNNTSGYIGVSRYKNKWRAYSGKRDSVVHLGIFETAVDAAIARDEHALIIFGDKAKLNFGVER